VKKADVKQSRRKRGGRGLHLPSTEKGREITCIRLEGKGVGREKRGGALKKKIKGRSSRETK